jgi:hypothetical protein
MCKLLHSFGLLLRLCPGGPSCTVDAPCDKRRMLCITPTCLLKARKKTRAAQLMLLSLLIVSASADTKASPHAAFLKSKRFWITTALGSAAMFADFKTTQDLLGRPGAAEGNPLLGSRPSWGRQLALGVPMTFASSYTSYRLSKSKSHAERGFSWIIPAAGIALHTGAAIHNENLHQLAVVK